MSLSRLEIMYGHLEGVNFARDPTGYLGIEAGIFREHGLEVSWRHVQGTEARYRRLESGDAHISFVVGRASLQHFLDTKATRVIGAAMNTCPYLLVVAPSINQPRDLRGKVLACKEGPARGAPLARIFREQTSLGLGDEVKLELPKGDQDAFRMLLGGAAQAALLPRPYGFIAEESGFKRVHDWPDIVDDPLPITMETTAALERENARQFSTFLDAHRESIRYAKAHREQTVQALRDKFGHSHALAAKTYEDYLIYLDDRLTLDFRQLQKLLAQVSPNISGEATKLASEWILPSALQV